MKKSLKKFSPNPEYLKNHKQLKWLSKYLTKNSIWNFNRKTISKAFAIGLFCAFLPIPFQMLPASLLAIVFSANIALSIALVWITNPITMPAIFYACYKIGSYILDVSIERNAEFSIAYVYEFFNVIWQPFLLGCLILSIVSSISGYWIIQIIYRLKAYKRKRK